MAQPARLHIYFANQCARWTRRDGAAPPRRAHRILSQNSSQRQRALRRPVPRRERRERASRARPIRSTALACPLTTRCREPRGPCVNTEQSTERPCKKHHLSTCSATMSSLLRRCARSRCCTFPLVVISLVYTPSRLTQRHAHLLHRMQSAPYMLLPGCRVHEPREGIAPSRGPAGHGWGRGAPARHRRGGRRTQASPAGAHTRLCRPYTNMNSPSNIRSSTFPMRISFFAKLFPS